MSDTFLPPRRGPGRPPLHPRMEEQPSRAESSMARVDRDTQVETAREGGTRRQRTPLSAMTQKMPFKVPRGYVGRWVNDMPGRIAQMIERGYDFVDAEGVIVEMAGKSVESDRRVCLTVDRGTGLRAYAMVISQEYHDEDQAFKRRQNEDIMAAVKGGQGAREAGDGRYSPDMVERKGLVRVKDSTRLRDEED